MFKKREYLLNRTKLVISRSGYSTIMDLAVIGAKALMIPTPGQIEQEYLGQYHNKKGTFYSISQNKINLKSDIETAKKELVLKENVMLRNLLKTLSMLFLLLKKVHFNSTIF